jgi:hypothetical protein
MTEFNYAAIAELFPTWDNVTLFPSGTRRIKRQPSGYGRFASAAYAIRFAMEELPAGLLVDTCMQVDERTFGCDGIRRLYESERYPLARRPKPKKASNVKHIRPLG